MSNEICGVFAPLTTPFEGEDLALDRLRENMRRYRKSPLSGYFVLGSNGESKSLSETEKLQVLEVVLEEKSEGQIVMAGAGYESTRLTLHFARQVARMGVDFVSLLTPSYFKKRLTDEALIGYFSHVADALEVPVLIYNAPGFTGVNLTPRVVEALARHPNIVGMKDSSPEGPAKYLAVCPEEFSVLSGTINTLLAGLTLGAVGGVVSLADAFPGSCCRLYERFLAGDLDGARRLHRILFRLNQAVSGRFGVAGVKYAMEKGGFYGGPPRQPLLPLTEEEKREIDRAVAEAGLA